MTGPTFILGGLESRAKVRALIDRAPNGSRVELRAPKRTLPQNDRLHAMITTIAGQLAWHGQKLSVDDWKLVFMDGLNRELRIVPNIRGDGFVNLGRKTSRLGKEDFGALMDLVEAFAAQHGIDLGETE